MIPALNCGMYFAAVPVCWDKSVATMLTLTQLIGLLFLHTLTRVKCKVGIREQKKASAAMNLTITFVCSSTITLHFVSHHVQFHHMVMLWRTRLWLAQLTITPLPYQVRKLYSSYEQILVCLTFWLKPGPSSWLPPIMFKQFLQLYNEAWWSLSNEVAVKGPCIAFPKPFNTGPWPF